jgi:hypothetical protein
MTLPPHSRLHSREKERLIALIITAVVLFSPPLLLVVDRMPSATGVWLVVYLFSAWASVIGLAAWLMETRETPHKAGR